MFTSLTQGVGRLLAVLTIPLFTCTAHAQWGRFGDPCACGPIAAPQYAAAPIGYNPCITQVATACPCMQPVTETVYREVPVTQYRAVKKTVQRPVTRTVYVDQEVTAYRQVMEQRTADVPTVSYQNVQEIQPVTVNRSYWQTIHQPVQKVSPCVYDSRPGLVGWMNRTSYDLRMAFTPNYIRRRQFVPNIQTVAVPYNRTVAIPGTRQVTYNVAKMEPYTTTVKVAKTIVEQQDMEVTAYEPFTTTRTVAVGNQTRWAFVDPFGGTTATASADPTPARSAQSNPSKTSSSGQIKQNSHQELSPIQQHHHAPAPSPAASPSLFQPEPQEEPAAAEPAPFSLDTFGSTTPRPGSSSAEVAGWKASRRGPVTVAKPRPPVLPVVAAN